LTDLKKKDIIYDFFPIKRNFFLQLEFMRIRWVIDLAPGIFFFGSGVQYNKMLIRIKDACF